ncbi:MAG: flagellin [Enterobacteriaceae bacterium]
MGLSIFSNAASMSSTRALNNSNNALGIAMGRLGTGKRINSAKDDAAGLQIATRLDSQVRGMGVAQSNISNGSALLQTTEGAMEEMTNILHRMRDLATQASNDTNSAKDREAMTSEFAQLNAELGNIMKNTSYGGEKLFSTFTASGSTVAADKVGKMQTTSGLMLQIGNSSGEVMSVNLQTQLDTLNAFVATTNASGVVTVSGTGLLGGLLKSELSDHDKSKLTMDKVDETLAAVSKIRSELGAFSNRLDHSLANVTNMKDNTALAMGNIVNADYAVEVSSMTRNQMLTQMGMGMLKQSNSMSGLVMQLL